MALRPLALLVGMILVAPGSAAAFTHSNITTPADGARLVVTDLTTDLVIEGSVTSPSSTDKADFFCLNGTEPPTILADDIDVDNSTGGFTFTVAPTLLFPGICRMHALPDGADPFTTDLTPFTGPLVTADHDRGFRTPAGHTSGNVLTDFLVSHTQPRGHAQYYSLGSCGLCSMRLFYDDTKTSSEEIFNGNAWFHWEEDDRNRSYLRVDGRDAVTAFGAGDVDIDPGPTNTKGSTLEGVTPVERTVTRTAGSDMTLVEEQDILMCEQPSATWPPSACGRWISTGVRERRTLRQLREGTLVRIEDVFSSTDGRAHALDLHWDNFFRDPVGAANAAFRFSWAGGGYAAHVEGDKIDPPPFSAGSIFVDTNDAEPEGSRLYPQGVMVFDRASAPIEFFLPQELIVPMAPTVPAGGSVTIRQAYATAPTEAELADLAAGIEDEFAAPVVAFTSPAEGAVVTQSPVELTGTAGDSRGVTSLRVDGQDVAVGADGRWSRSVTLTPGEHTFTAVARDAAGNEASATRRIVYAPPPAVTPLLPPALDRIAPVLSRVGMTNRRFAVARGSTALSAAARRGTRVRYSLSEAATVTFAIARARPGRRSGGRCRRPTRRLRTRPRCTRWVRAGRTLRRASPAGRSTLRFTGRIGRRALRPGRHRMAVRATDAAGNRSGPRRLRFRIVRR